MNDHEIDIFEYEPSNDFLNEDLEMKEIIKNDKTENLEEQKLKNRIEELKKLKDKI